MEKITDGKLQFRRAWVNKNGYKAIEFEELRAGDEFVLEHEGTYVHGVVADAPKPCEPLGNFMFNVNQPFSWLDINGVKKLGVPI